MSETDETAVVEETGAVAVAEETVEEPAAEVAAAAADVREARVFVCERGHRAFAVWSTPTSCRAHVNRRDECGRQLYPIGELPEQVQKALNPLKASKKSSKK